VTIRSASLAREFLTALVVLSMVPLEGSAAGDYPSRVLPDVPTIAKGGLPGHEAIQWAGLLAPTGTPRAIIDKLHKEVVSILRTPQVWAIPS
jgi:tripartite-type tricarboxylate transporter receptor subunit TctC